MHVTVTARAIVKWLCEGKPTHLPKTEVPLVKRLQAARRLRQLVGGRRMVKA